MSEQYNQSVATHHSSYRPPLHGMILARVLSEEEAFRNGLDVGCGTGRSAVALAKYCLHVHGVEPTQSMLDQAIPHERVTYLRGAGQRMPLVGSSIDVVTFAGSLYYAKSHALVKELKRVCRGEALVIPYDFEMLMNDVLRQFGVSPQEVETDYDHGVNFSDAADFVEIAAGSEQVTLEVRAAEVAHVLLVLSENPAASPTPLSSRRPCSSASESRRAVRDTGCCR